MSSVQSLVERIRGEFSASEQKLRQFQQQQVDAHQARVKRLEKLETIFEQLRDVCRPRLEALAQEFGDRVAAQPIITPGKREATFEFQSPLATIRLKFVASANTDVTQLVVTSNLEIQPMLMEFERHSELAMPLDEFDPERLAQWLDDRILAFVKTYLSLHENEYYLKDQMVTDPIAQVRFPKFAAGATRERAGKTYYFISEETAGTFDHQAS